MIRYAAIDLETTGTDDGTHQVIEIGAVIDDLETLEDVDELPSFHCYVSHENYVVNPYVLGMHVDTGIFEALSPYSRDTPENVLPEQQAMRGLNEFLTSHIDTLIGPDAAPGERGHITVCGHNFTVFDFRFIRSILDRGLPDDSAVWDRNRIHSFDPCHFYMRPGDDRPAGTRTASRRAGLDGRVAHTAVDDSKRMIRLARNHLIS